MSTPWLGSCEETVRAGCGDIGGPRVVFVPWRVFRCLAMELGSSAASGVLGVMTATDGTTYIAREAAHVVATNGDRTVLLSSDAWPV